jgi:hypothetical protein
MHDVGPDLRLREHRAGRDRQAINDGDQDIADAAVLRLRHDAQSELRAVGLFDPNAQHVRTALRSDTNGELHDLVPHRSFIAHLNPQSVE